MEPERNGPRGVERDIALRESAAVAWLLERGVVVAGEKTLRVVGDEISTSKLRLARVWQSSSVMTVGPGSLSRMVFLAEGSGVVTRPRGRREESVGTGRMFFVRPQDRYSLTFDQPSARYEIDFAADVADEELERLDFIDSTEEPSVFRSILVSSMNSLLNSTVTVDDRGFSRFHAAMSSLVMAALLQSFSDGGESSRGRSDDLYRRALHLIRENFADPEFSVEALAGMLQISRRHLYRVFADIAESAPGPVLRAERARRALQLLQSETTGSATRARIAARSGFRSPQMMRRALQVHVDEAGSA